MVRVNAVKRDRKTRKSAVTNNVFSDLCKKLVTHAVILVLTKEMTNICTGRNGKAVSRLLCTNYCSDIVWTVAGLWENGFEHWICEKMLRRSSFHSYLICFTKSWSVEGEALQDGRWWQGRRTLLAWALCPILIGMYECSNAFIDKATQLTCFLAKRYLVAWLEVSGPASQMFHRFKRSRYP